MKAFQQILPKFKVQALNKTSFINSYKSFSTQVQPWVEVENRIAKVRGELVLSDKSNITKYAINLVKGYYRTTNKEAITLESQFSDHGLDSLDSAELCTQLEDELGYIIEAETIPKVNRVKHIVNLIEHFEAYKQEFKVFPQEKAHEGENWDEWIPKGEKIKSKLFSYTKKKNNKI